MEKSNEIIADKAQRLNRVLPAYIAQSDAHINHAKRLLSSTANVDTTLLTITYTLHFLHSQIDRLTALRLSRAADQLISKLTSSASNALLPGETLVATIETSPSSRLLRANQSVAALAGMIDNMRMFMRLWGLLGIYAGASTLWKAPPQDSLLKSITWAQISAIAIYQGLENSAYLASNGVLELKKETVGKYYLWSGRFWMAYVVLEFASLARQSQLRAPTERAPAKADDEYLARQAALKKQDEAWWRKAYVSAAYFPMTIHYSMQEGYASEGFIGALGMAVGYLGIKEAWKSST